MPNALAHFGIQGVLTRFAIPTADPKVIFLGCLLPDVPWVLQRVILGMVPGINPYDLRLYVIVQASLFMTFLLCGSLAFLSKTPVKVFVILSLSSILHLGLDALQTKWANGVHFFAPISWELLNVGWFWPESLPTYILTVFGLGYVIWTWKDATRMHPGFCSLFSWRSRVSVGLLFVYLALPFVFIDDVLKEDNHFVKTLQAKSERIGRPIEFDRKPYVKGLEGDRLQAFGERHHVRGVRLDHNAVVSIRGRFVTSDTIELLDIHEHANWLRDGSSYVGIILLIVIWTVALFRPSRLFDKEKFGA